MARQVPEVQPLAFRLRGEARPLERRIHTLSLPGEWLIRLRALYSQVTGRTAEESTPPVGSLVAALRLLVPDVIYVRPGGWQIENGDRRTGWWFAEEQPDLGVLCRIIRAWVREEFSTRNQQRPNVEQNVESFLAQVQPGELAWRRADIEFANRKPSPNGTAATEESWFTALPDYICSILSEESMQFVLGSTGLRFKKASGPSASELISWPPLRRGTDRWSYVLRFSVQTLPRVSHPILHCRAGVRRWVTRPLVRGKGEFPLLANDADTSVFLLSQDPWLVGIPRPRGFATAKLTLSSEMQGDRRIRTITWEGSLVSMLRRLGIEPGLPDAMELARDPLTFLERPDGSSIATLFSTRLNISSLVKAGVPLLDRGAILDQVAQFLAPIGLEPTEPARRVTGPRGVLSAPLAKGFKQVEMGLRQQGLARAVENEVSFELLTQPSDMEARLRREIASALGLGTGQLVGNEEVYDVGDLTVRVRTRPLGALGTVLTHEDNSVVRGSRDRRRALQRRTEEVAREIGPAPSSRTIALVELRDLRGLPEDPKEAIRWGLAMGGRLSQFISPPSPADDEVDEDGEVAGNADQRVRSAVLDTLRQLGYLPAAPFPNLGRLRTVPQDLQLLGLWIVRLDSRPTSSSQPYLPVFVRMLGAAQTIRVTFPQAGQWFNYSNALLEVATRQNQLGIDERGCANFISTTVRRCCEEGPTLLIAHRQNAQHVWSWLNNKSITVNGISFSRDAAGRQAIRGLRIARLRDTSRDEVPQWYSSEDEEARVASGVFEVYSRLYYSIQSKTRAMQPGRQFSKIDRPTLAVGVPAAMEVFLPTLEENDELSNGYGSSIVCGRRLLTTMLPCNSHCQSTWLRV
jgi:hypothetical protein